METGIFIPLTGLKVTLDFRPRLPSHKWSSDTEVKLPFFCLQRQIWIQKVSNSHSHILSKSWNSVCRSKLIFWKLLHWGRGFNIQVGGVFLDKICANKCCWLRKLLRCKSKTVSVRVSKRCSSLSDTVQKSRTLYYTDLHYSTGWNHLVLFKYCCRKYAFFIIRSYRTSRQIDLNIDSLSMGN